MSESVKFTYPNPSHSTCRIREDGIESGLIGKLQDLKYVYREDICDRLSLEKNFREKFESLNRVRLTDSEFARLLAEIVTPDVFAAAKTLREINSFTRDDGTPLNYTLVNIKDWCKNTFDNLIAAQTQTLKVIRTQKQSSDDEALTESLSAQRMTRKLIVEAAPMDRFARGGFTLP